MPSMYNLDFMVPRNAFPSLASQRRLKIVTYGMAGSEGSSGSSGSGRAHIPQLRVPSSKELERMRQFRQQQQFRQQKMMRRMQREAEIPPPQSPSGQQRGRSSNAPPQTTKQPSEQSKTPKIRVRLLFFSRALCSITIIAPFLRPFDAFMYHTKHQYTLQQQSRRRSRSPDSSHLQDGLSTQEFKHLVQTCNLEESWRPQVGLLHQLGLSPSDFSRLSETRPEVFQTGVSTMRRKLAFLKENIGLSDNDLAKVVSKFPRILEYKSETTLKPRLNFLHASGVQQTDIAKVFIRAPMIMSLSLDDTLEPRVSFLKDQLHLPEESIGKLIVRHPQVLTCSEEMMKQRAEFLSDRCGLSPKEMAKAVLAHPQVLHYKITSMEERLEYLSRSVGMDPSQIAVAVARFPQIFSLNVSSNMAPKWRYLVEHLGGGLDALCSYPGYFSLSLANRIVPRHKYLVHVRGDNAPMPFPMNALKMTDKKFATEVAGTTLVQFEKFKLELSSSGSMGIASVDELTVLSSLSSRDDDDDDAGDALDGNEDDGSGMFEEFNMHHGAISTNGASTPTSSAKYTKGLMSSARPALGLGQNTLGSRPSFIHRAHPE